MTPAFDRKRLTTDLGLAAALAAALAAGWFVFAWRMAPDLLTAAYEQRSLPVINDRITGQNNLPLSFYLDAWLRVRGRLTVLVLGALAGLLLTAPFYRVALAWLGRQLRGGPTTGLVTLICIGGSAGWIGGAIEAVWEHQRHIDLPYGPSVEQFWLAPTAGAVTATLILLVLRASTGRAPISIRIATATIWSLVLFSLIRDSALGIHPVAAWLLAIGLGSQLAVPRRSAPQTSGPLGAPSPPGDDGRFRRDSGFDRDRRVAPGTVRARRAPRSTRRCAQRDSPRDRHAERVPHGPSRE